MATRTRTLLTPIALVTAALLMTPLLSPPADAVSPGVDVVYVADGRSFADALVGGALAAANNSVVLTVEGARAADLVPQATKDELTRLKPKKIVILGGLVAISQAVEDELATYTDPPGNTDRIEGNDRYHTAALISQATADAVKNADKLDGLDSTDFARSGKSCSAGSVVTGIAADGSPTCVTKGATVVGYAHVSQDGTVYEADSFNVVSANVSLQPTSAYCFGDLPFDFTTALVTPDYANLGNATAHAQFAAGDPWGDCDAAPFTTVAEVATSVGGSFATSAFYITFYD